MRIAIDIDGVLADFVKAFQKVVNTIEPGRIPAGYVQKDWDWSDVLDKKMMSYAWEVVRKTKDFWTYLDSDHENVLALSSFLIDTAGADIDVYYVTSRVATEGETVLTQTQRWLYKRGLLLNGQSVIVMPDGKPGTKRPTKGEVYHAVGISSSVDDYQKNVREALQHTLFGQHTPYLLNRPYNEAEKDLDQYRVGSLKEYLQKVLEG